MALMPRSTAQFRLYVALPAEPAAPGQPEPANPTLDTARTQCFQQILCHGRPVQRSGYGEPFVGI